MAHWSRLLVVRGMLVCSGGVVALKIHTNIIYTLSVFYIDFSAIHTRCLAVSSA